MAGRRGHEDGDQPVLVERLRSRLAFERARQYRRRVPDDPRVQQTLGEHDSAAVVGCHHHARASRAEGRQADRSEEPTSELQSLMRISYAVFCWKKKIKKKHTKSTNVI